MDEFIYRTHGKSKKGERITAKISGKRFVRQSIISARNHNHKFIAPYIYNNTADTTLIIWWIENTLLPELALYQHKFTLVWDNAAIHKSETIKNLIQEAGHTILFLPPYSPDLNPIEHKWHELKHNLRKCYDNSMDFIENLIKQINLMSSYI